jgi:hypothetical protein
LIVLAAVLERLSPRFDLSFIFYRKERSIQGDFAAAFLVGRMSQVI